MVTVSFAAFTSHLRAINWHTTFKLVIKKYDILSDLTI
jgi:hypothetical protein